MPGAVQAAAPSVLMPEVLCSSFDRTDDWPMDQNRYYDGSQQSRVLAADSRKKWKFSAKVTPALLASLRTFYNTLAGPLHEFYFYDLNETSPPFTYDPTATSIPGLYIVRFQSPFTYSLQLARHDLSGMELWEVG